MTDQFVDMLEQVQRPQVARLRERVTELEAELARLRSVPDEVQAAAERLTIEVEIHRGARDEAPARSGPTMDGDIETVARFVLRSALGKGESDVG